MPDVIEIRRELKPLSKANILDSRIFSEINTWPYSPKGTIGQEHEPNIENIWKEYSDGLSTINRIVEEFVNTQRTIVSWLLAVMIGVWGNLAVGLLFVSQPFQSPPYYLNILFMSIGIMLIMIATIFFYYPTNCIFRIAYSSAKPQLSNIPTRLQMTQLSPKANVLASYAVALNESIMEYEDVISLAILRDEMRKSKKQAMRIREIKKLVPNLYVPYIVTLDLKHRYSFWYPQIADKIRNELLAINQEIMQARILIGVYGIDSDEVRWEARGHVFLNEISEWDFKEITKKIEDQILCV